MEEEHLSARFDILLKRYQEKLSLLQLDLPSAPDVPDAPETPAAVAEPAVMRSEEPKAPVAELPAWEPPALRETPRPSPTPVPMRGEEPALAARQPAPKPARTTAPAAAATPRSWRARWLAGSVLVLAAAWWGYGRFGEAPAYRSFSLARTAVRGLSWREGKLVVADADDRFLLLYDTQGRRLDSKETINAPDLEDLAWVDGAFWSTAQGRSAIFQHDQNLEHGVRRIYATPNRLPAALSGDNENLWAADAQAAVVYRYLIGHSLNGVSLTPLNQYNLTGAPAANLYAAEGRLWILDSPTRRLTRYSYDAGTLAAVDAADLGSRLPPGAAVKGLVVGGDFLWVLTAEPAVLHRFALRGLRWQSARG